MEIGQTFTAERAFSQKDFDRFAILSGDDNPIHVDPDFSARTKFGKTVAHGMLLYSTISALLGKLLPGEGIVQLSQELMFPTPTFVDEQVTFYLRVSAFPTPETVEIEATVTRPNGEIGCTGKTRMLRPGAAIRFEKAEPPPVYENSAQAHRGLKLGQSAALTHVFSGGAWGELGMFLALVGDGNLLFWDQDYARWRGFAGVLLPGGLIGGLISDLLGTDLPGRGTNWLKQRLSFPKPAYPNATLTATVEIIRLRPEKELVNLRTTCVDPTGDLVLDGEALVWVSDLESG